MAIFTPKLNLQKPQTTDTEGVASSLSDNFQKIDDKVGDYSPDASNTAWNTLGTRLNDMSSKIGTLQSDVSGLQAGSRHAIIHTDETMMFAHRGNMGGSPENTLSAIAMAGANGYFGVELDVHATNDSQYVMIHDSTIDRTSNGVGTVASMSLSQVQAYDYGLWYHSSFANEPIPTLDEAMELIQQFDLRLMLEIKPTMTDVLVQGIVNKIKEWKWEYKTVLVSFDKTNLEKVRVYDTTAIIPVGWIKTDTDPFSQTEIDALKAISNSFFSLKYTMLTSANVDLLETNKVKASAWTIDDPMELRRLRKDEKIKMFITNILL